MADNKIKYGLKNVHWAPLTITDGVASYGALAAIPGAVSISLPPTGERNVFNADDSEYYVHYSNNGYDGSLEIALIPETFAIGALGHTKDANGVIGEASATQPSPFALLFEFQGDQKGIRHVLYNCTASRPTIESGTKEGPTIAPKTDSLNLEVRPLPDGKVKDKTGDTTPAEVINAWYDSVYLQVTAAPALTVISLAGSTVGKTAITVSPALTGTNTYVYKTAASVALPAFDAVLTTGWTAWDGSADITATTGNMIVIAEIDGDNKCKLAGSATVVSAAE